jgi:structural maintenance of chromosome 1
LEEELSSVRDQLGEAKSDRQARESDAKLRDTLETLKAHFAGIRGTISELCSVLNPKYALALAIAFGRHLDSVIVDTQSTAIDAISFLREQRLQTVTFIPLDTIKVRANPESLSELKSKGFTLAIQLISFDDDLTKAYLYALGDTLVCDSDKVSSRHCTMLLGRLRLIHHLSPAVSCCSFV